MTNFAWTEALSVDDAVIDADHRELIALINELQTAIAKNDGSSGVVQEIDALFEHTHEHFEREEAFMLRTGYSGFLAHKIEHEELLRSLKNLADASTVHESPFIEKISTFLFDLLFNHILYADKKLSNAVRNEKSVG